MGKDKKQEKDFKAGLKSFGKGIGTVLNAMAEASAESRRIEQDAREVVEQAIRDYESATGQPFVQKISSVPALGQSNLPWNPARPGHLVNCREHCSIDHCLTCGRECYGRVYCYSCS